LKPAIEFLSTIFGYSSLRARARRRGSPVRAAIAPVLAGILLITGSGVLAVHADPILGWLIIVYGLLLIPLLKGCLEWNIRRLYRAQKFDSNQMTTRVSEEGLFCERGETASRFGWKAVQDVEDVKGRILFWLNDISAVVVPGTSLRDGSEAAQLTTFAKARIRAAQN
jgi:hypothetical protein